MAKKVVATLAKKNHFTYAKQLFSNIYWNTGWDGDYLLLTPDDVNAEWFADRNVRVLGSTPVLDSRFPQERMFTTKLRLFSKEMKEWDTVIYFDTDILIKGALDELAEPTHFSGIKGHFSSHIGDRFNGNNGLWKKIKKSGVAINGGVWSFNTEILNANTLRDMREKFRKFRKNIIMGGIVEAMLALFFYGKITVLPRKYNHIVDNHIIREKKFLESIVLHFMGEGKCYHPGNLFYPIWKTNLNKAEHIKDFTDPQPPDEIDWERALKVAL
jgi:lipopolysaccharide biosynthesis glycosyltransferase